MKRNIKKSAFLFVDRVYLGCIICFLWSLLTSINSNQLILMFLESYLLMV